ncbi:MAG: DUF4332 domain-containing protein [Pseudomonadota bacterium]
MSLLFKILYAAHAKGTHHKLALHALRLLSPPEAVRWRRLFLFHAERLLEGAKAPDTEFKDFANHVRHPADPPGTPKAKAAWGGAPDLAEEWGERTRAALAARDWGTAAYAYGVLTHYYTDPWMPFHTGSSPEENDRHRAVEWSVNRSFETLWPMAAARLPVLRETFERSQPLDTDRRWLASMVDTAANTSAQQYWPLIDHYDLATGVKTPEQGLDPRGREIIADMLALAALGSARMFERLLAETRVSPPEVNLTAATALAGLRIPVKWVTKKLSDANDRAAVAAMAAELTLHGAVKRTLPRELRDVNKAMSAAGREMAVRPGQEEQQPARSVTVTDLVAANRDAPKLGVPDFDTPDLKGQESDGSAAIPDREPAATAETSGGAPKPAETAAPSPDRIPLVPRPAAPPLIPDDWAEARSTPLTGASPVVDAPSIGPKTAARLEAVDVSSVKDLLDADPRDLSERLNARWITAEVIARWQDQARWLTLVPRLKQADAVLLVESGYRREGDLSELTPADVLATLQATAKRQDDAWLVRRGERLSLADTRALLELIARRGREAA